MIYIYDPFLLVKWVRLNSSGSKKDQVHTFDTLKVFSKGFSYPACALRALGLLLAHSAPTVGRGKAFTKMAVTWERKVEKSLPRWEMNGHSEGYKRAIDQNWGPMAKIGFLGQKPKFWAQKKGVTF